MSDTNLELLRVCRPFLFSDKYKLFKITPCRNLMTKKKNNHFFGLVYSMQEFLQCVRLLKKSFAHPRKLSYLKPILVGG